MRIESLTAADLKNYIDGVDFLSEEVFPITLHRAESQLLNPDLERDDIILTVARDERGRVAGFIGALPGQLDDGTRFAWNSGWWMDPVLGRESGMPLFYTFLKQWNMRVMFSDLTPLTCEILTQMGMFRTRKTEGVRLFLRAPLALVLPSKNRVFRSLKWLFHSIDYFANIFIDIRLGYLTGLMEESLAGRFREIDSPGDEETALINGSALNSVCKRVSRHFDWIMHNPWILTADPDIQKKKYPFSSFSRQFIQKWFRTGSDGKDEVLLMVSIRDRHLKMPYLFYRDARSLHVAAELILWLSARYRVSMITTFHPVFSGVLAGCGGPILLKRKIQRLTAVSGELSAVKGEDFFFQDGDGDSVFT